MQIDEEIDALWKQLETRQAEIKALRKVLKLKWSERKLAKAIKERDEADLAAKKLEQKGNP